ncbi:MAG: hypothetical protein GX852_01265, partial [Clostridiales bacterium]|nr:hypothetical protein [Clostridiales bacterium]
MKRSLMSRIVALTMSLMILLTGSPVLAFAEDLGSTGAASGNENTTQTDGTTESNQDANADSKATTP